MKTFARIQSGFIVETFTAPDDATIGQYFPSSLTWIDITNVSPVPQNNWMAAQSGETWTFSAASVAQPNYKVIAQDALDVSDRTVIRCAEHEVAVPDTWKNYRVALRAIVNTGAGPLPSMPAYPADT